jgi:2-iminobutanoate/2-iminopropanoate deaminase
MTMGERASVHTENAPAPFGGAPYSQAMVTGDLVFVSGQVPIDPATGSLVEGGVAAQTEQVLRNVQAVLEAAGSGLAHALKTTVFLTDLGTFGEMNEVYARHLTAPFPARSTFEVSALPAGASIEIECIATRAG